MDFNYNGYELTFIQKKNIKDGSDHLFSFIYKFYSPVTKLNYVLIADCHANDFISIKFYPKCYRKSDYKYNLIVNRGDLGNIVITCIKVIPILLGMYPTASFGFAAARTLDRQSRTLEPVERTQRFKLYCYVSQKTIGNATFQHFEYPDISGYILVNRNHEKCVDELEKEIASMLRETYNDLPMP